MKIDINETDHAEHYKVKLNGKEVELCVAADDDAGTVQVLEQHWRTGETIPDGDSPYGYRSIELKGKVEITRVMPEPTEEHPVSYPDYSDPNNFDPYNPYYGCTPLVMSFQNGSRIVDFKVRRFKLNLTLSPECKELFGGIIT